MRRSTLAIALCALFLAAAVPQGAEGRRLLGFFDSIGDAISNAATSIGSTVSGEATSTVSTVGNVFTSFNSAADDAVNKIEDALGSANQDVLPQVEAAAGNLSASLTALGFEADATIGKGVSSSGDKIKAGMEDAADTVQELLSNSSKASDHYKSAVVEFGSIVVSTTQDAVNAAQDSTGTIATQLRDASKNVSDALSTAQNTLGPVALGFSSESMNRTLEALGAMADSTTSALADSQIIQNAQGLNTPEAQAAAQQLTETANEVAAVLNGALGNANNSTQS